MRDGESGSIPEAVVAGRSVYPKAMNFANSFVTLRSSTDSRYQRVMDMPLTLAILSLLGTAVFAASGALVAAEKRFDLVGAVFLSVAAGMGGGTIVDLLVGERVRWLDAPELLWAALFAAVVVFAAGETRAVRTVSSAARGPGAWCGAVP